MFGKNTNYKITFIKILKYISIFIILINIIVILFAITLLLFFDYFEINRPMILLNLYLFYSHKIMIPINIINTILVIKFKDYYSEKKYKPIIVFVILQDIISVINILYALMIYIAITNRIF